MNLVSSVTKSKISLESAKHINDRVVKLLRQTVEVRESNMKNGTRRSKIKSIGMVVSQNYPITDYYKSLHDKKNQSDHSYRVFQVSHRCNYGVMAFLATS